MSHSCSLKKILEPTKIKVFICGILLANTLTGNCFLPNFYTGHLPLLPET
ncbi:Uncharacterized protein APZ42_005638 [Daphnia magna]|uniref:Uncharacterized protein n=1 Tax=Daphnia magna TaxID=35525 RepID=A0A164GCB0_9CRUS|nr:Uncharacterized protein APZ42_005638 [Daphnia magna]